MDVIINARQELPCPEGSVMLKPHGNFYHHLLSCLHDASEFPPVADLLRCYHGLQGRWLVVSPIHWQATHNDAMVVAESHELCLFEEESRRWFSAFAEFSAAENMNAYYCDAHTWLLQYDDKPDIQAKPVHELLQQSLLPHLQTLDKTGYWQRFITESQMFFSAHGLNDKRPDCIVNGVWLWGHGRLNAPVATPVICSNGQMAKLAQYVSSEVLSYSSVASCSKNAIVLMHHLDLKELERLQKQLRHIPVRWHWNNVVYRTPPKKWFSRLWSSVYHAN
ncbi:hypothetical protein [Legionella oakridgensis]|uniref:Cofactor-independent phosphoglycerate mutase n=2 Tax=Legionella oakridgensis TaxID=29423 RepID=W0BBU7_9GAMM|nr:hypothetical protein [Legionella oakridgensis]AHE67305.1 hypothetical protein Loa_01758 [Legionella oakridgensis ATCC 33761 = DSM 21215]ETO93057.1 hypothetical protein LOR_75c21560 [Legionella oakridgensis RV-2-2007]KTD37907.1 cofactor-independent phosphoglycerate mutase [Legionella oakridgensis]STY20371.1 Uncharacterized protein conserved in bacteria [Legionella longbeachae]